MCARVQTSPARAPPESVSLTCLVLELKKRFETTHFPLWKCLIWHQNRFLANIRDHEIGFSDFCFDLELKKYFKKT